MKKELLLSLGITMMLLLSPWALKAQTVYMTDGFENGFSPTCDASCKTTAWTQEYYDASKGAWVSTAPQFSQPWKTETTGLQYPDGAAVGKGRAYFRNEPKDGKAAQTAGYRTRLITPVMDLSKGYQPILRFYHAQAKYTGDFDTLRVYYRTGEGLQWNLISEYTTPIKSWKFEEIGLPAVGEYYQIAFEASENIGRGIVLDSVLVRTRPQITTPHDITFIDVRDNGATIQWQASKDADAFEIALFDNAELDLNVTPEGLTTCLLDTTVDSEVQMLRVENLLSGRNYYVQIRSIGERENSVWCEAQNFRIKPVVYLPYTEKFNLTRKSDDIKDMQVSTWYWGGDYQPMVHLFVSDEFFGNYSPDGSAAVSFISTQSINNDGNFYAGSAIPAGSTSLLVSPEIADKDESFNINQCHVEFYGTVNIATGEYAQSIIVGVMTDPEDITTFVPVDTCKVWGYKVFDLFDVSLASYTGNGRYVAFLSHFDKINLFHLDNVTIEKRPAVGRVQRASMHVIPTTTTAQLSWDAIAGATQYNVKYVRLDNKGIATPIYDTDMGNVTAVTTPTNSITLNGLQPQSKYVISVQAVGGEWSQPKEFQTSAEMTLPTTFHFEEDEGVYTMNGLASTYYPVKWMIYSNSDEELNDKVTYPALYKNYSSIEYAKDGNCAIGLKKTIGADAYIVAPMINDTININEVEVVFYSKTREINPGPRLQVGVMTDPTDLNTFVQIDEFVSQPTYQKNYVSFEGYQGTGRYIAVRWAEVGDGITLSNNYIDAFTIRKLGSCPPVSGLAITPSATSAVITWNKGEASKWKVKVNSTPLFEAEYDTKAGDIANEESWTTNSYNVENLRFARNYYVYVQTVCDGENVSEWTVKAFKTDCPNVLTLPYTEDFDYLDAGTSSPSGVRPDCWFVSYIGTSSRYPCLTGSYSNSPKNSMVLKGSKAQGYGTYIAMPALDTPLEDVKVTYYAKAGYNSPVTMYVGIMTDPNDAYTFVTVDSAVTTSSSGSDATSFREYSASFGSYQGTGTYIAFGLNPACDGEVYLDDITVFDITDRAPFKFSLKATTPNSMTVAWEGKTTEKWDVIVSSKYHALTETFDPTTISADEIVAKGQATANEYAITEGLTAMTTYYFYVKSSKGSEWGMDYFTTECERWNPREGKTEDFESYGPTVVNSLAKSESNPRSYYGNAQVPLCWTVGNGQYGTDLSKADDNTKRGNFPYICTNGSATVSSYADKAAENLQYAAGGINSLKISHSATTAPAWAAMNQLDCSDEDLQQLIITGNVQGVTSAALIVGVMDDPEDLSTFVVLDSITKMLGTGARGGNKAIAFEVPLQDYKGTGRYIAFRTAMILNSSGKYTSQTVYLDNINVSLASCAAPKVTFSRITDTSARVYSGLRIDNAWKYYLGYKPFDISEMDKGNMPTDSIIEEKVVGDGWEQVTYASLTNLKPNTTYYVAVATMCDGKMSAWKTNSFHTLTPDVNILDFHEGFSQYDDAEGKQLKDYWVIGNTKDGANVSYLPTVVPTVFNGELNYMLQLFSEKEKGDLSYAITHGLTFPEGKTIKDYQLHCRAISSSDETEYEFYTSSEYCLVVGIATDPSDWNSVTRIDTLRFSVGDANTCIVPFDTYTGTNGKYVVLMNEPLDKTKGYVYVDSLYFEEIPSCRAASKLTFDNVTKNSFTLTWQGLADKYNVAISTEQYSDEEKETAIETSAIRVVNGKRTVFTNLQPNTRYYAYVQSLCSDTEKGPWAYGTHFTTTDCDEMMRIPFGDNFDGYYEYGVQPPCYYNKYIHSSSPYAYPKLLNTTGHSGTSSVQLFGNKSNKYASIMATQPIDFDDFSALQIAFAGKTNSSTTEGSVIVGLVKDLDILNQITDIDSLTEYTFYPLDTCTATGATEWTTFFLNLNDAKYAQAPLKEYKHIAFVCKTITGDYASAYFYMDDLKIRPIPTCYEPLDLTVDNIGYTTADIHITPYSEEDNKWQARITNVNTKTSQIIDITTPDAFTLTGLEHSSLYNVEVRTDCGDMQSDWMGPITFGTKYMIEDYYTFTFTKDEQGTQYVRVPGATNDQYLIHPALTPVASHGKSGSSYPYSIANTALVTYSMEALGNPTSYSLIFTTSPRYQASSSIDSATVILPLIMNPQEKQISFYMRAGAAYTRNYTNTNLAYYKSLRNTVSENSLLAELMIGVVDSAQSISTFQPIAKFHPSELVRYSKYLPDGSYETMSDTLKPSSLYGWDKVVIPLNKLPLQGKQIALMMSGDFSAKLYIDTLAIESSKGFMTPAIQTTSVLDTSITVEWNATGAAAYNIYVVDSSKVTNKTSYIPYLQDAEPKAIISVKNVVGTSCTIDGLQPNMTYSVYVEDAAHAGQGGALSPRKFITTAQCEMINGNGYHYGFEPGAGYVNKGTPAKSTPDGFTFRWPYSTTASDTTYKIPNCWTTGISFASYSPIGTGYRTSHPNMILNTKDNRYSLSGDGALQLNGSASTNPSSNYTDAYAIMPLLDIDMDTAEVVFYGRCYYEKKADAKPNSIYYLKGGSYSQKITVGTVTNPADMSTYSVLDTLEYDYDQEDILANTVAVEDSFGIRYFQKFAVPLKGAKGQYIAFRQVGGGLFFIDDVTIQKRQTPRKPRHLAVGQMGTTTAELTWQAMETGGTFTVQYMKESTVKDWTAATTISGIVGTAYTLTGLDINTKYIWRVRHDNSDMGSSIFAHHETFRTDCEPLNPNGYHTGFECNEEDPAYAFYKSGSTEYKQNDCWSYLNWGTSTSLGTSWAYNIPMADRTGYSYAHSGTYALKLMHNSAETYRTVAVTPFIDAPIGVSGQGFDTLQVSFWACPQAHGTVTGKYLGQITAASGEKEAKMIEVGTCTDPNDTTTYTVLATCIYQCENNILAQKSPATAENDFAFQKFTVRLDKATGPYVFFRTNKNRVLDNGVVCTGATMYLDDIQFETLLRCDPVVDATISDLTNSSALLTWQKNGGHHFDVQVSADATFLDDTKMVIDSANITDNRIAISGLNAATSYFYRIKTYCDETGNLYSDWTQTANFITARVPMYNEDFTNSNVVSQSGGWTTMTGYAKDVFAGAELQRNNETGADKNWYRLQNNVIKGWAYRISLYNGYRSSTTDAPDDYQEESRYQKSWLITPQIAIEDGNAQLVFDAAISTANYSTSTKGKPIREHARWNTGWDDQFMVIISDDAGQTWKRENATIWNNEKTNNEGNAYYRYGIGDYCLTDMTFQPQQITIDLSKYAGKQIKVAFYGENSYQNADYAVHIDNVHINYLVTESENLGSQCQFEDIDNVLGFSIDGDTAHVGAQHYQRMILSTESDVKDSLFTMDVEYREAPIYNYEITVCEGTPFEYMGFNEHTTPGTYRMKLKSQVNGCDSIVNFTLRHTAKFETYIDSTICDGSKIMFNGQEISQPGEYTAELKAVGGCDSIVTLKLTTKYAPRYIDYVSICQGESFSYGGKEYTQSGTYGDTIHLANGCDSMKVLVLTVYDPIKVTIDTTICEGKRVVLVDTALTTSGTYTRIAQSVTTGCDSIITMILHVEPAPIQRVSGSICEGETYWFGSRELTSAGVYYDTIRPTNGCMSITELTLTINKPVTSTLSEVICQGGKFQFGDTVLTTAGMYERTLASLVTGCDSIITLTLTVTPAPVVTQTASICEGTTYDFNGKLLSKAGIYRDTTYSSEGCMSITELTLTINKPVTSSIIETICEGSRYILGDTVLTTAGTYERTLASLVTGCDSIVTLTLYVTPASVSAAGRAICEGNYYDFNGKHLTEAGVYRDTTYTDGCMSITELTLTVNKPVESATSETICEGGKYQFGDTVLTTAGTYKHTFTSLVTRCDSVVTLTLTVTPAPVSTQAETICEGSNYDFNGKLLSQAGIYRDTTYAEEGCMSITELTLTVTPAPVENKTAEICEDATFEFAGKQLNIAGTYRDTTYTDGCMTITELLLTVNKIETIDVDTTIHIEQLPFLYKVGDFSYIILPDTTKEGTYEMDTVLVPGSCTSYHFNIVVKTSDAVDNIDVPSLHIYPTLINKGQSVNLILNAAPANNDVVIEIHDMVGQLVATYRPTESHVVLGDFNTAGIYFIRVLTDANISGVGRVVVK